MTAGWSRKRPWSSAWVSRPKKVRSADREPRRGLGAESFGLDSAYGAIAHHPAFGVGWLNTSAGRALRVVLCAQSSLSEGIGVAAPARAG